MNGSGGLVELLARWRYELLAVVDATMQPARVSLRLRRWVAWQSLHLGD
jgi:hypothetical protein